MLPTHPNPTPPPPLRQWGPPCMPGSFCRSLAAGSAAWMPGPQVRLHQSGRRCSLRPCPAQAIPPPPPPPCPTPWPAAYKLACLSSLASSHRSSPSSPLCRQHSQLLRPSHQQLLPVCHRSSLAADSLALAMQTKAPLYIGRRLAASQQPGAPEVVVGDWLQQQPPSPSREVGPGPGLGPAWKGVSAFLAQQAAGVPVAGRAALSGAGQHACGSKVAPVLLLLRIELLSGDCPLLKRRAPRQRRRRPATATVGGPDAAHAWACWKCLCVCPPLSSNGSSHCTAKVPAWQQTGAVVLPPPVHHLECHPAVCSLALVCIITASRSHLVATLYASALVRLTATSSICTIPSADSSPRMVLPCSIQ